MESGITLPPRLPRDVLHRIFSLCAPTYQLVGRGWRRRPDNEARDVLAHSHLGQLALVCRFWRFVALTPDLWSTIEVDFETRLRRTSFAALLTRCVERSGTVPLTLHVRARYPTEECMVQLIFLARESDRWRVANIETVEERGGEGWLSTISKFSLLETLHIRPYPTRIQITDVQAPRLTRVAAWNTFKPYLRLPWAQLETVYLRHIATRSLAEVLKSFRPFSAFYGGALHLAIDNCDIDPSGRIPTFCAPLGELHITLREWCSQPPHTNAVLSRALSSLRLPRLHTLQLFSACEVNECDTQLVLSHAAFLNFVEVSLLGDTLTTLSLVDVGIPESKLPECLAALPALTHLTLSDLVDLGHIIITDNILRRLAVRLPGNTCTLLPRLTHFTCYTLLSFDDDALRDFVAARVRNTPATGSPTFTLTVNVFVRRGARRKFGLPFCRFISAHQETGELACKAQYVPRAVDRDVENAWASVQ
ncbi:hypothetical protein GGX14DRAFT_625006 [Mycena pura]|uniref:F-box domain-containing protein n=1 Tax=Mycena pura TaxID=153505 RepID=A0AAD6VMA9_9AGAR|nr:hypothetical protein GGX14DRAFT_625006 [Mycena pura]